MLSKEKTITDNYFHDILMIFDVPQTEREAIITYKYGYTISDVSFQATLDLGS